MNEKPIGSRPLVLSELVAADRATRVAAAHASRWLDLYRAAGEALSEPHLDALLRAALEAIARMLDADAVSLLLANDQGSELVARAAFGLDREVDLTISIPAGAGISGPVLETGKERIIADLSELNPISPVLHASGQRSYVGVPLTVGDRTFGVLHATSRQLAKFDEDDAELLTRFALPIAAAVERVRLFEAESTAKQIAERATVRVQRLQRITAALVGAITVDQICQLIIEEAVLDSSDDGERAIWMLRDGHLVLVAGVGVSHDYPEIPLDSSLPAAEILRQGEPLFVETRAELSKRWPILTEGETSSFAALPLIVEGQRLGVMAVGFRSERHLAKDERDYLIATAEQAAVALARASTREELQAARNIAEERREQLDFLAEASERLSKSLDLSITMQAIADLSVPYLTDRCALFLLEGDVISKTVLAPDLNNDEMALFEQTASSLSAEGAVSVAIRTGQSAYLERIEDSMLVASADGSIEHLNLLRRVGFGGMSVIPLRARGRNLGALAFVNRTGRPLLPADRALAEELSARAAMAIDNAILFSRESHTAHRLAASLLPARLPTIEGLDVAVRYQFGTAGVNVGGDFYDVLQISDEESIVLIGDVQGKGVEAAAMTGLARHTVRASARYDTSPSALLVNLNTAIIRNITENVAAHDGSWRGARLCTAAIIRLVRDGGEWIATVSSAGHPIPVLRRPDGTVENTCTPALLLGVEDHPSYANSILRLTPGSIVLLYTDGISERHDDDEFFGSEGIMDLLSKIDAPASQVVDEVVNVALLHQPYRNDDLVVLAIRLGSVRD